MWIDSGILEMLDYGFVDKIEGSYNNVVGFPIENILKNLAKLNYFPNKEL